MPLPMGIDYADGFDGFGDVHEACPPRKMPAPSSILSRQYGSCRHRLLFQDDYYWLVDGFDTPDIFDSMPVLIMAITPMIAAEQYSFLSLLPQPLPRHAASPSAMMAEDKDDCSICSMRCCRRYIIAAWSPPHTVNTTAAVRYARAPPLDAAYCWLSAFSRVSAVGKRRRLSPLDGRHCKMIYRRRATGFMLSAALYDGTISLSRVRRRRLLPRQPLPMMTSRAYFTRLFFTRHASICRLFTARSR